MATLTMNFQELLKGIPRGAWVAVASDQKRVVAYGAEMRKVLEDARELGEQDPIIFRVPESESALIL